MADKQRTKERDPGKPFVPGDARINRAGRPPGRAKMLSEMLEEILRAACRHWNSSSARLPDAKLPLARRLEAGSPAVLPWAGARACA